MTKSLHLTFFGSGPVAASSLAFLADKFSVDLVVTKSRPPHHKDPAPVESYASEKGIKLSFANSTKELSQCMASTPPKTDIGIVIDYGVIIGQDVIDQFKLGIINSHFSLLPEWRGADPITYSLLSGQEKTGVSIMLINLGLDTGLILGEETVDITYDDNNQSLTAKLIETSNSLLERLLPMYAAGAIKPKPQPADRVATYSRKLLKTDGTLDVNKPAIQLEREIRAYSDWPKSRLKLGNMDVIVTTAVVVGSNLKPGEISTENNELILGTKTGALKILELMPVGKKPMPAKAFLNGYRNRIHSNI